MSEHAITHLARIAGICVAGGDDIKEPQKDMIRAAVVALRDVFTAASKRIAELEKRAADLEAALAESDRDFVRVESERDDARAKLAEATETVATLSVPEGRDIESMAVIFEWIRGQLGGQKAHLRSVRVGIVLGLLDELEKTAAARFESVRAEAVEASTAALERQHAESAQGEWRCAWHGHAWSHDSSGPDGSFAVFRCGCKKVGCRSAGTRSPDTIAQ